MIWFKGNFYGRKLKKLLLILEKKRDWSKYDSESNLAKSIIIEAAELLEHFQWNEDGDNIQEIKDELQMY